MRKSEVSACHGAHGPASDANAFAAMQLVASLAALRDDDTGAHLDRIGAYVRLLAGELAKSPAHATQLSPQRIEQIVAAAPLHDIGKVGICDALLLKPAALTPEETTRMRQHVALGLAAIAQAERNLGGCIGFMGTAKEIIAGHHERWDGSGYPRGLHGEQIPLSARLVALADVYDALRGVRPYKMAMDHAAAMAVILAGRGSHFDPAVVDAFVQVAPHFERITQELGAAPRSQPNH